MAGYLLSLLSSKERLSYVILYLGVERNSEISAFEEIAQMIILSILNNYDSVYPQLNKDLNFDIDLLK